MVLIYCRLEEKYEEHPLIDVFNVYIQIFLSQALEPGFLSAIIEEKGKYIYSVYFLCVLLQIYKAAFLMLAVITFL